MIAVLTALAPHPAWSDAASADVSEAAHAMSERMRDALWARCPQGTMAEMLAAISAAAQDAEIAVIEAALAQIAQEATLCESANAAVASARQAAQLAIVSATGTGAIEAAGTSAPTAPPNLFSVIGAGAPGGGGATDYNGS